MIKDVKIRILALFMAVTLSFCVCSNEYYQVKALEWVAPVVGFDTAMKFLLGLLGIATTVEVGSNVDWEEVKDGCVNYQIEQGNSAVAVSKWWDDILSGTLDTASTVWSSFKEWAKSNIGGNSTDVPVISGTLQSYMDSLGLKNVNTNNIDTSVILNNPVGFYYTTNGVLSGFTILENFIGFRRNFSDSTRVSFYINQNPVSYYTYSANSNLLSHVYSGSSSTYLTTWDYDSGNRYVFPYSTWFDFLDNYPFTVFPHEWVLGGSGVNEGLFDGAFDNVGDIALAPDIATDIPIEGDITIPWENVGETDSVIDDAIDAALERVHSGVWTLDKYWSWVQNVTNIFAYDITNNYLLPNDGDDEKADDKVQQNINRGAMVLYGLEKVFPFCIPWDIYAFVNLLVADPVAPVIEYPIYNPVSGEDEIIMIDFSVWESQVILMRYIQDFLLIIGLLLLARSLIGAGGSD